jgi:hypothetical protein
MNAVGNVWGKLDRGLKAMIIAGLVLLIVLLGIKIPW